MNIDKDKLIKDTTIRAIKDTLKQGLFKWSDTGKLVSFDTLLDVLSIEEPISLEEAQELYSFLFNDSRITRV
ncbi:hypothetical protein [Tenacibaculum agarivorans]|uniref:hypothetical protein n=1 Tax=Tenacibaculum agarivorans TaxID=1908389 RepID=UPI00094B97D7|nr:hypothetical protein [Tenacibaculum agarivorans]